MPKLHLEFFQGYAEIHSSKMTVDVHVCDEKSNTVARFPSYAGCRPLSYRTDLANDYIKRNR